MLTRESCECRPDDSGADLLVAAAVGLAAAAVSRDLLVLVRPLTAACNRKTGTCTKAELSINQAQFESIYVKVVS